jgi:hypothetical protein
MMACLLHDRRMLGVVAVLSLSGCRRPVKGDHGNQQA